MLALDYTTKYPDRVKGLILLGSSGYDLDFLPSTNQEIFSRVSPQEGDSLTVYFEQLNSLQNEGDRQQVLEKIGLITLSKQFFDSNQLVGILKYGSINPTVNTLMMTNLMSKNWNLKSELEKLDTSAIIINGIADPIKKEYVQSLIRC